jgi:hypothetical protein
MAKIVLLTIPQVRQLFHQELATNWFFNPAINKHGNVFIDEKEVAAITNPNFDWVKLLPLAEEVDTRPPTDLTPPASDGIGIVVNASWRAAFDWPLTLNGFEIALKTNGSQFYIERSLHDWAEFRKELAKAQNDDFRKVLSKFFAYLKNTATRISV